MMKKRILSLTLAAVMLFSTMSLMLTFAACGEKKPDALVVMTEELDGVFNPFYNTTASDSSIVSMTQIGMLTSEYKNGEAVIAYGDEHPVVVKDYIVAPSKTDPSKTTYTFVIKNGLKFSDGQPLTIEDVLFNLYVYLDPVYSGSSTMYSTNIVGLQSYRQQKYVEDGTTGDDSIAIGAAALAKSRINELVNLFRSLKTSDTDSVSDAELRNAILVKELSDGYIGAISNNRNEVTTDQLLQDYELTLQYFREELEDDYVSSKEAYLEEPYKSTGEFDEVTSFMYTEGYVDIEYALGADNKVDRSKIVKVTRNYTASNKEEAINYVFRDKTESKLDEILSYWATANRLLTDYTAKAKEVLLHQSMGADGKLAVPNIAGIVSLGHTTDVTSVTAQNGTYTVAHTHNADGTPAEADTYDVLEITINGVDPKAIWNFSFAVAPQHYYAPGYTVDIANDQFGVAFSDYNFHKNVIQSSRNVKVPMGAGPYMATNVRNEDNPDGNDFYSNYVVYFKSNPFFCMEEAKIEKLRYQVVSASNALNALQTGQVHFATPQFTQHNINIVNGLASQGIKSLSTDQLGYGYIGINAGKVKDINLRKAIMTAMDTSLSLSYYGGNMAERIYWPMSTVSWAYPKAEDGTPSRDNGHDYPAMFFDESYARDQISEYMALAGVSAGDSSLKITFTIAGSNLTDHPSYQTFQGAADLLNSMGWDIEVVPDSQALTKLSSGSLAVWAAAWGTTIDPDMYQVYHKNSTATSTLAWGYREILNDKIFYAEENAILLELSELIDRARETEDRALRSALYEDAMGLVLDLAIELPVYQRGVLYAYNSNVIDTSSLPSTINPYTSPLDHIWEVEFAD